MHHVLFIALAHSAYDNITKSLENRKNHVVKKLFPETVNFNQANIRTVYLSKSFVSENKLKSSSNNNDETANRDAIICWIFPAKMFQASLQY